MSGNNLYRGGTTIASGTLQLGNGGATGSIVGNVIGSAVLAFYHSDAYSFSGRIGGQSRVVQLGTGSLTLSGTDRYSGGTERDSGTLVVDNASALGAGNLTLNAGILTAAPQPINVQGNYFQRANGTLQLVLAGANPGQHEYLNVTGNATSGGTLQLVK